MITHKNEGFKLFPIGRYLSVENSPCIYIKKEYLGGLKYLDSFSHALILYAQSEAYDDKCTNKRLETNLLQKIVKIVAINQKTGQLQIEGLDSLKNAFNIYDIKPYFPCEDRVKNCFVPKVQDCNNALAITYSNELFPIGTILKKQGEYYIELQKDREANFKKLEGYSHIKIFWWFHKYDKPLLRKVVDCDPPYENAPRTGIFASRSPVRPNPIALTTARILSLDKNQGIIKVSHLDCFDKTPCIGLLPYRPDEDIVNDFYVPDWLKHWPSYLDDRSPQLSPEPIMLQESPITSIQKYLLTNNGQTPKFTNLFTEQEDITSVLQNGITIKGARQNNLKNINVTIPYHKITVITGVSGSGKSSLAFDTLFAESQQRFMESMSTSKRSLYKQMGKPQFDHITGLPPAIAISQRNVNRNPRSTVGTMTDLYDYLGALFTHIGIRHCPECGNAITPLTEEEISEILKKLSPNTELCITPYNSPIPTLECVVPDTKEIHFPHYKEMLVLAVNQALALGQGAITVTLNETEILTFQTTQMCYHCNHIFFELTPSIFSFNNPESMCPICKGLGMKMDVDPNRIVTKPHASLLDEASPFWGNLRKFRENPNANWMKGELLGLASSMSIDLEKPWKELPEAFRQEAIFGSGERQVTFSYKNKNGRSGHITRCVEGAFHIITRLFTENTGDTAKRIAESFMENKVCDCCNGERLSPEGRMIAIGNKRFPETTRMTMADLKKWLEELPNILSSSQLTLALPLLKQLHKRLTHYIQVGVPYLTLDRSAPSLSGGELQRLRLVTQLGSGTTNILYVLDEPSTGLHPMDHKKLIGLLQKLKVLGNTIVIVEHDSETMLAADYIIDIGPCAGDLGGYIIAEGTPEQIMLCENSETGKYLAGEKNITIPSGENDKSLKTWVSLTGAKSNNLKNITITFPTCSITCITGVSGSGKSSLVSNVIYPAIDQQIKELPNIGGHYDTLTGQEAFDKIVQITQSPIGRSSRSTPATYTGAMDEIRTLFAHTDQAKQRRFKANQFSFNNKEGQCSLCKGEGEISLDVQFMPHISAPCSLCKGRKFNNETLEICYRGKNIFDVLEMNVATALTFFEESPKLTSILKTLADVGLGYLKLGQSSLTLSGGEAQRIKLATALNTDATGRTLYLLDEPTTGLHFVDIQNLLIMLKKMTACGNTVILIEHNLDIIKNADWIIDLGPEGGSNGGYVIAQGSPSDVANTKQSCTGRMLKKLLGI